MLSDLSLGSTAISGSDSSYGPGTGPIHLGGLECTGDEGSIFSCDGGSVSDCTHSRDAAVICERDREFDSSCGDFCLLLLKLDVTHNLLL